jgi:membrane protein
MSQGLPDMDKQGESRLARWIHRLRVRLRFALSAARLGRFFLYTLQRFLSDGCLRIAAGLSYATLLALVPLFAIALAVLAGFPAFARLRGDLQRLVLDNVMPEAGAEVSAQLTVFIENASSTTGLGVIALAATAILLLSNINGALNAIWRVAEPRPLALRFLVYWALLTLGPLLIGASLSLSSYAFAVVQWSDIGELGGMLQATRVISIAIATLGFTGIYFLVPNRVIDLGHALIGGLVAAVMLELLKAGFGWYLRHFPTYQAIYGAVATVPIVLVWMYLAWSVTLFGAEVAAALPEWRAARSRGRRQPGTGGRLALALSLLGRLNAAAKAGQRIKERQLSQGLPATPAEIDSLLRRLRRNGYIARTLGGRWLLGRDLGSLTLGDLLHTLDLDFAPGQGWHPAAEAAVAALAELAEEPSSRSLAELLALEGAAGAEGTGPS